MTFVLTHALRQAIAFAKKRPKGVIVSVDLFRELAREGKITRTFATPWGLPAPDMTLELPYLDGDIYIACDPEMSEQQFKLPPDCL